jgi:hypothetical protein
MSQKDMSHKLYVPPRRYACAMTAPPSPATVLAAKSGLLRRLFRENTKTTFSKTTFSKTTFSKTTFSKTTGQHPPG